MKKLTLLIGLLLNTFIGFPQIEFQATPFINHSPGVEIGFTLTNTTDSVINTISIQTRRLLPTQTPSSGANYTFTPPFQPGDIVTIYPFNNCLDITPDMVFQSRIYTINGTSEEINHEFSIPLNEDIRCFTETYPNGVGHLFCDGCGVPSNILTPLLIEPILKTEYYTITGQYIPFEELQLNVLYIIKETTPTGFNIYKTIPK